MMYRKIIVPLDGSILSEKALPYVIRLSNQLEAKVLLIKVVDTSSKFWPASPFQQSLALLEGQEYLTQVRRVITDPNLKPCLDPDRVIGDSGSGWDARYRPCSGHYGKRRWSSQGEKELSNMLSRECAGGSGSFSSMPS